MSPTVLVLVIALQTIAAVFFFRAIRSARTSQGAVGWAMLILFLPFIGVPAYMVLGSWRFRGHTVARRESAVVVRGLRQLAKTRGAPIEEETQLRRSLEAIADMPVTRGNGFTLLSEPRATFDAMFAAIDAAERYVLVQFYIIRDDALGHALKERLAEAVARGVTVRLLYDAVGSKDLSTAYLDELRVAGVAAHDLNGLFRRRSRFQINFRNHRKTLIVDGKTGFTGGFNVGDEYLGLDPRMGAWRDTHCRLTGPVVSQLQLVFAEDWYNATREPLAEVLDWESGTDPADMRGLIVATGPADQLDTGALYFCACIHAAQTRLWIATPYMVVENDVLAALKLAALRGVEVRLLVPEKSDSLPAWLAGFAYFDELRDAGVEISSYGDGFMHQKVLLIDDRVVSVGTTNLDNRSCRLNFEATAVIFDSRAAAEVEAMLAADFALATQVTERMQDRRALIRYGAPVARLFAPVL